MFVFTALMVKIAALLPKTKETMEKVPKTFPWYLAIFLALIDYKSSNAYVFGLSLKVLGPLAPIGIVLLCITTMLIWLVYKNIVAESPFGRGSIALYEKYLGGWFTQFLLIV